MTAQELEETRVRWIQERPQFQKLGVELASDLKRGIRQDGISADVTTRPKEVDSLIRKLLLKKQHTYESLGDKVGVRAIVRCKDQLNEVLSLAGKLFDMSDVENTADRLSPSAFGYLSVHANIRFRDGDPRATEYPANRFGAELQVRTLAQHLWAEMAHDSVYKFDEKLLPLSSQLKRRIYILAGAIELADEEFNRIEREMPSVPEISILKALERWHYRLTTRTVDPESSLEVIRLLSPLYRLEARQVVARLDAFYSRNEQTLRAVYEHAADLPDRSVFLFQPEALLIFDLLETDQVRVRKIWGEHYPPKELERFANAFGISFD